MPPARLAPPLAFLALTLPVGLSTGFTTVTLPFVLTHAGIEVETTAAVVAVALLPQTWRFAWGPLVDLTLTLRRWYLLALGVAAVLLLLVGLVPIAPRTVPLVGALAFLAQAAAQGLDTPVGALMAHGVADERKGRAAGWYQAGTLCGTGLGGGAGVWLWSHAGPAVAMGALVAAMLVGLLALPLVPDVRPAVSADRVTDRLGQMGRDVVATLRVPEARLFVVLALAPIGIGAASNLWSAVAPAWRAGPDVVAVVTGGAFALATTVGAATGGGLADRVGRWRLFFGVGLLMAGVALTMALGPRTPAAFVTGVVAYALVQGLAWAAYSALLLQVIGRGAAATKYGVLASLGNVPVAYGTALDGWAHGRWGVTGLLLAETVLPVVAVTLGSVALARVRAASAPARAPTPVPVASG